MLVSAAEMTRAAFTNGYAIGAFNAPTLDAGLAIIEAGEQSSSPVIVMIWGGMEEFTDLASITAGIASRAARASVPVAIHLDHSYSLEQCERALQMGMTSIMFDGAALPYEKNIELSKQARALCDANGASLEGVVGDIGQEAGEDVSAVGEVSFTDPQQAAEYAKEVSPDLLAIAVGTTHGHYQQGYEPDLNVGLAEQIHPSGIPMVLHGGSFAPDNPVRRLIKAGIAKINVATELEDAFLTGIRTVDLQHARFSNAVIDAGYDKVKELVKAKMALFGSAGMA